MYSLHSRKVNLLWANSLIGASAFFVLLFSLQLIFSPPFSFDYLLPKLKPPAKVLGKSTIAPMPKVLINTRSMSLLVTAIDYASGQWNYRVDWTRYSGRRGSIYINDQVFVTDAAAADFKYTGFNLSPQNKYKITFYSRPNRSGSLLTKRYFTTPASPDQYSMQPSYLALEQTSSGLTAPPESEVLLRDCREITSSGLYILSKNLTIAPYAACFNIHDTQNVTLDCNNRLLTIDASLPPVLLDGSIKVSNVRIFNVKKALRLKFRAFSF